MILGTGMDLVEVTRIESAISRFGDRFLQRVLSPREIDYCQSQGRPALHVAARFAGKEAASKAFGTGIGAELGWQDMEIIRTPSGRPEIHLVGLGAQLMKSRGGRRLHLSLTHTAAYAAAVVIIEG